MDDNTLTVATSVAVAVGGLAGSGGLAHAFVQSPVTAYADSTATLAADAAGQGFLYALPDTDGVIREKWVGAADKNSYQRAVVAAIGGFSYLLHPRNWTYYTDGISVR